MICDIHHEYRLCAWCSTRRDDPSFQPHVDEITVLFEPPCGTQITPWCHLATKWGGPHCRLERHTVRVPEANLHILSPPVQRSPHARINDTYPVRIWRIPELCTTSQAPHYGPGYLWIAGLRLAYRCCRVHCWQWRSINPLALQYFTKPGP
jgi:hypothetical protein